MEKPSLGMPSRRRAPALIWLVTAMLFGEQALWAGDSYLLAVLFAAGQLALTTLTIRLLWPEWPLWRRLGPPLLCLMLMLLWLALPELGLGSSSGSIRFSNGAFAVRWVVEAGYTACFVCAVILGYRKDSQRRALFAISALGVAWELVAIALSIHGAVGEWGMSRRSQVGRFVATQGNANVAGVVFAMITVLALGYLAGTMRRRAARGELHVRQALVGMGCVVGLVAIGYAGIIATGSRTAILLVSLSNALQLALVLRPFAEDRKRPIAWLPLIGVTLVAATALSSLPTMWLPVDLNSKFERSSTDLNTHIQDVRDFLDLSWKAPVFGYGPGTFGTLNRAHLDATNVARRWDMEAAHSIVVGDALEAGWPHAVLALIALILCIARVVNAKASRSRDDYALSVVLALAIAAVGGLIDISLDMPAVAALAAWLFGLLVGRAIRAEQEMARPQQPNSIVLWKPR